MDLVWKYGRLCSIPFSKSSIPIHSGIFHIPYRNSRSIPFYFPYHALVVDSVLLSLLLHFTPTIVASLKIRKRLILKKLLPLPAPFQHFRFEIASASNLFHQSASFSASTKKITASASSFRFHIPGSHCYFATDGISLSKKHRNVLEVKQDTHNQLVASTMRQNRFLEIHQYLHTCENLDLQENDKFGKLIDYIFLLNASFFENFQGVFSHNISIDKTMVL